MDFVAQPSSVFTNAKPIVTLCPRGDGLKGFLSQVTGFELREFRNAYFQSWHGHLAREKGAIPHEMSQGITGKMPVPRYFASPSSCGAARL
jgi:hypothetical protein